MESICFHPAEILLPSAGIPLEQWGCIACDQFTSDADYWQRAAQVANNVPSALHLVLPEVYLSGDDVAARAQTINETMRAYTHDVLTRTVNGYVYLERTMQNGTVRKGIVGKVDLEAYSYEPSDLPAVRPSECTVVERIPPRLAVRRGASLETPHVMMLIDDAEKTVIEPIAAQTAQLAKCYEGELMLGGGHLVGFAVEDDALVSRITAAVAALGSRASFDAKYPAAAGAPTLTLAVGDGNHSLATAKAYWEECKATLSPEEQATHPARYCLCEVCNVHSDAIEIEPIHRVLFGTQPETVKAALTAYCADHALGLHSGAGEQTISFITQNGAEVFGLDTPKQALATGSVDAFIETYLAAHTDAEVDYVHDEAAVNALCAKGGVGFLMPPFAKSDIFKGVVLGGVLPRKTFSMGHAEEKRYYVECRQIMN